MASPRDRARSPSLPPLFTETARDKGHSSAVATPVAAQFDVGDPLGNDAAEAALLPGQSRKRKRLSEVDDSVSLLGRSFVLKPQSSSSNPQPHTLYPVMVLPREHVPLSMLDFHAPYADIYAARRFTAPTLRIVDLETRRSGSPHVLIAVSQNKKMFVLDACDKGVFAICQIGFWVKLSDLIDKASICNWKLAQKLRIRQEEKEKEREKARAAYMAKREANDIKRASISRRPSEATLAPSLKDRPASGGSITPPYSDGTKPFPMSAPSTRPSTAVAPPEPVPSQEPPAETDTLPFADAPPTSESIFDGIRSQYSESLYKSQGPLTYFAKGPLSRARAAFSIGTQDDSKTSDLITFLRSLIMTPAQLDNKYRDRIPEVIRGMKGFYNESDNNTTGRPKKKRTRKMKIGRDGLFPYEESKVRSWWRHNMPELKEGAVVTDSTIKSYAMLLRTRETQMQLILILEALALESVTQAEQPQPTPADDTEKPAKNQPEDAEGPEEREKKDQPEGEKNDQAESDKKKKKKQNLEVLADLLADRLGIWQSTISDEMRFIESVQRSRDANIPAKTVGTSVEPLKDFCTDVIIPFFAKRLPEVCDAISRKLGGPSLLTKKHAPKAKDDEPTSAKKEKQTPGAVTKRTAQPRSSKSGKPISLGQVLEQAVARESRQSMRRSMSHGPRQMIEAMKTTQPREVPGLKREASESQLARRTEHGGLLKAPGLSLPRSQSLVGATATDDAKAHKRAQVEAELKNAISAIRKPNRELAGRAISDESERRTLAQIKKNRKPQRMIPSSSPQVIKATPMRPRYRNVSGTGSGAGRSHSGYSQMSPRKGGGSFSQSYSMGRYDEDDYDDADVVPPSSALRPAAAGSAAYDDDVVGETPAKKRFRTVSSQQVSRPGVIAEEYNDDDDAFAAVGETPARPTAASTTGAAILSATVAETPRHAARTAVLETPVATLAADMGSSPPLERTTPRRRSSGIKGLLFPTAAAGRRRSGPVEFKSPARRQPRASAGGAAVTTTTTTTMAAAAAAHVTVSPFASATARSLAVKLAGPAAAVAGESGSGSIQQQQQQQQQQQHGDEQAVEASPLKNKVDGDIFAQLGWNDFDDI